MGGAAGRRAAHAGAALLIVVLWLIPRRAPATIAEQRARLPPAAECDDELVAGIWRSHNYNVRYGDWSVFTLRIRRDPNNPSQLTGTITNHNWDGTAADEEPPECAQQTGNEWVVSMDARGTVTDDLRIEFGAYGEWRLDSAQCHSGPWGYNLDHFSGVIEPSILEFQSVNNDGGRSVNERTVFRRIRCPPVASVEAPSVNPRPPDFYPDSNRGCSWR
ncbi:MAG: hypothetical protein AB8I08_04940 [Sandaracinaceae bacterium]